MGVCGYSYSVFLLYLFVFKSQDSDYMSNDSKVAPERNQIGNYVTITSSAVDTRRYFGKKVPLPCMPNLLKMLIYFDFHMKEGKSFF